MASFQLVSIPSHRTQDRLPDYRNQLNLQRVVEKHIHIEAFVNITVFFPNMRTSAPVILQFLGNSFNVLHDEQRLSVMGEVEAAVEVVGLVRAGRLRQAVLRSAFEGRL